MTEMPSTSDNNFVNPTAVKSELIVNGGQIRSRPKHVKDEDAKERKFDLNSFTTPKNDVENDADEIPLAIRMKSHNKGTAKRKIDSSPDSKIKTEHVSQPIDNNNRTDTKSADSHVLKKHTEIKNESPPDDEEDEDDVPLSKRTKIHEASNKREIDHKKAHPKLHHGREDVKKSKKPVTKVLSTPPPTSPDKKARKKKGEEEEQPEVWRWWEETNREDGVKWTFLEHKGPLFAPEYVPLPSSVHFYYDGKPMKLNQDTEEMATFYAKMLDHDYVTKEVFNKNFFKDWRKVMTSKEKEVITDLTKCNFKEMHTYFTKMSEERKNRSKEEKQAEKEQNLKLQAEMGVAVIDGHKEKIGNFRIEPPGLFRGRGSHPKMGMLKRRVRPQDVIINCSKDSKIPAPPHGHKWKEVRHDNTVTWLASWNENIMGSIKYIMLNPSSKIKGEKDWQKYETARRLKLKVQKIRETYKEDWKSKEMRVRQRAVALYFIDKLALRAGNEKEEGETADTVGCCSLRCEHIKLHDDMDGEECVVEFDFLGKDSIRYYNRVAVEKRVFKNLKLFMEGKSPGDDLFDRLNTTIMNKHLGSLMENLSAKVFRTYNASFTLQQQLDELTKAEMTPAEKLLSYNRANRQVAILCNHQRAAPKSHDKQMETLQEKIKEKRAQVKAAKGERKDAKKLCQNARNDKNKKLLEMKEKAYERLKDQLQKLEVKATDKEENKEIALGTSKLNYLDPRISIAWCKKWDVPIDKVYNKTQREKFRWAIDMAEADFQW